jgi:cytochrome c oxidase subunit IV
MRRAVSRPATYLLTYGALLLLSAATLGVSLASLGTLGVGISLAIAATKAVLIALFFMHLREQRGSNAAVAVVAVVLVAFFVGLSAADVATRGGGEGAPVEAAAVAPLR